MVEANQESAPTMHDDATGGVEEPDVYVQDNASGEKGTQDIFTDQRALEFSVRDPQDFHGHIVYVVKGKDNQGEWECKRRFNEFFVLYDALVKRWPGIVLPQIPPKKAMGNKDIIFLQERRFYLERFLRKLSQYDFIINSEEFQLFCRPQGLDVEKSLTRLIKMSSSQLFDRLKEATGCQIDDITEQDRNMLNTQVQEFQVYIKKAAPFLKKMKDDLAQYLTKKQMLIKSYAGSAAGLSTYEEGNLAYYVEGDPSGLVMNNMDQGNLIESLRHTVDNLRNPFTDLYHWIKGEIYDLSAFSAALHELKSVGAGVESVTKKIAQSKSDIENIQAGKKTMNTLFKNTGDVHKIQGQLETYERDLEAQKKLFDLLRIYIGRKVIPSFKNDKLRLYSRIVQQFHVVEINNSHQLASFWAQVLKVPHVNNANLVQVK